jgi:hypothetical protein
MPYKKGTLSYNALYADQTTHVRSCEAKRSRENSKGTVGSTAGLISNSQLESYEEGTVESTDGVSE